MLIETNTEKGVTESSAKEIEVDYQYLIESVLHDEDIKSKEQAILFLTSLLTRFHSFCSKFGIKTSFHKFRTKNIERMIKGSSSVELLSCPPNSLDKLFKICNDYNIKYNFK